MSSPSKFITLVVLFVLLACVQAQWFGGWSQPSFGYNSAGFGVDAHDNSFIGTQDNEVYLWCNGIGCPGRI